MSGIPSHLLETGTFGQIVNALRDAARSNDLHWLVVAIELYFFGFFIGLFLLVLLFTTCRSTLARLMGSEPHITVGLFVLYALMYPISVPVLWVALIGAISRDTQTPEKKIK
jgi:hypothetical protein